MPNKQNNFNPPLGSIPASLGAAKPGTPEEWFSLGVAFTASQLYSDAERCFLQALAFAPNSLETMLNLGYVLGEQGRSQEALDCYDSVLKAFPACAEAHYNRAAHLLRAGDYIAGFAEYEARFAAMKSVDQRAYPQPRWDGSPLGGRSILVYCEQGLGDALQFCRYVPLLAEQGAKVILEVQRPLVALLSSLKGVAEVVAKSDTPPITDFHISLLTLPHIFGTTLETIPASVPYIAPSETLVADWRKRIEAEPGILRVGLAWAGKERPHPNRSCPPEYLAPLLAVKGVRFFSLQIGERDRLPLPPELAEQVIDLTDGLKNFADAGLIANLDLVITIDTAVAHLAGALGKPVWVLLPAVADWRWLEARGDSPWYPTMRLFRQSQEGDWSCVVGQAARALCERIEAGTSGETPVKDMLQSLFETAMELLEQKAFTAAIFHFRKLLAMLPDDPAIWYNLGSAYRGKENFTDAELCFQKAIAIKSDSSGSWLALGELYLQQAKYPDAERCLRTAHELVPESFKILILLGAALIPQEKMAEAFDCSRKVLAIEPECLEAVYNLGYLQLRTGNYLEGFKNFEARLGPKALNSDERTYRQPRWDGSHLEGKSILVFGEQGLGDVIQFCRYLPLVARKGGKIVLEVDAPLIPLLEYTYKDIAQVIPKSETPPATDVYIQTFSLPYIFHTTLDTIPDTVPYLAVDPRKLAKWRALLAEDSAFRVGLVWRGSPRNPMDGERSCALAAFSPLAAVEDVSFYSLQLGAIEESKSPPEGMRFIDPGPIFEGLTDTLTETAALIANLDLVISVDTAVIHLAGAIGKPVWLLLACTPDWRWMVGREDSPWYPTMRLFRQDQRRDWGVVIDRVRIALESLLRERPRRKVI